MSSTKGVGIRMEAAEDWDLEHYLSQLDIMMRGSVVANALRAAGAIVQTEAVRRIPRSIETGTAKKKSQKQKRRDQQRKPLADSIDIKLKHYDDGRVIVAMVGPKKEGPLKSNVAHAHLVELGHKAHYWSKEPSSRKPFVEAKRWLAPAVDTTQSMQFDAMVGVLEKAVIAEWRKRRRAEKKAAKAAARAANA